MSKIKAGSVFIATPTHVCKRYCAAEFCREVTRNAIEPFACSVIIAGNSKASCSAYYSTASGIEYRDMEFGPEYFGKVDSIHRRITDTALYLRERFLLTDAEWYLSLESDVILWTEGFLPRMVGHNVPVLHTNCYPGFNMCASYGTTQRITMGCTLIKREVIEKISFRYNPDLLGAHYDALFAHDCNVAGIKMYYDPSIQPIHKEDRLPGRGWMNIPESERGM